MISDVAAARGEERSGRTWSTRRTIDTWGIRRRCPTSSSGSIAGRAFGPRPRSWSRTCARPCSSQGGEVFDGLKIVHADVARRRVLAEAPRSASTGSGPGRRRCTASPAAASSGCRCWCSTSRSADDAARRRRARRARGAARPRAARRRARGARRADRARDAVHRPDAQRLGRRRAGRRPAEGGHAAYRTVLGLPGAELVLSAVVVRAGRDGLGAAVHRAHRTAPSGRWPGQLIRAAETQPDELIGQQLRRDARRGARRGRRSGRGTTCPARPRSRRGFASTAGTQAVASPSRPTGRRCSLR